MKIVFFLLWDNRRNCVKIYIIADYGHHLIGRNGFAEREKREKNRLERLLFSDEKKETGKN